jgi:hypothetical protein
MSNLSRLCSNINPLILQQRKIIAFAAQKYPPNALGANFAAHVIIYAAFVGAVMRGRNSHPFQKDFAAGRINNK